MTAFIPFNRPAAESVAAHVHHVAESAGHAARHATAIGAGSVGRKFEPSSGICLFFQKNRSFFQN